MTEVVSKAIEALKAGKTILYPTDTIWGVGCDATDAVAVAAVTELKGRGPEKSYIILVDTDARLERHVKKVPDVAWQILDNADEPITLILPAGIGVADEVLADDGSIAIRVTKNQLCKQLIRGMNRPLLSTSANLSGQSSPKGFSDIDPSIRSNVGHIVDLRPPEKEAVKPSTIIKLGVDGAIRIIRR